MNTHARLSMDKDAFFRWGEKHDGRFELKDGRVVMMVGATKLHAAISSDIVFALKSRLGREAWSVTTAEFAVDIDGDIRYPDVLVEAAGGDAKALSTDKPVVIVEVLSASSIATDLNVKAAEYMSLASLETYIVASQDEPRLWLWNRSDAASGRGWPKVPEEVHGKDKSVPLPVLGLELPMADIYAALPD
jgi:Uma2 family endonuclease